MISKVGEDEMLLSQAYIFHANSVWQYSTLELGDNYVDRQA